MLEKITLEELEFCEMLHYPVATVETLFSDFDNLTEFDEEKFGDLRIHQYPFLSFESIIDENVKIKGLVRVELEKAQFNLRKGVGDVYNFGARKYGKCEYINNYCSLANGDRIKFGDLIGKTRNVISLNQNTLKLEETKAYFYDNGIKDCYKLILKSGKEIIVTGNHPFLTANGWKSITELKEKDFIATPRKYNIKGNKKVSKNEAKLLGYLIGDGSCNYDTISFTNINEELIQEFSEIIDSYNCSLRKERITYNIKWKNRIKRKYTKGIGYNNYDKRINPIKELVLKYNINKLSKKKIFSQEILKWNNSSIALLLNRLFACDSHINYNTWTIELTLASKDLIYQIHNLLLRFGINSRIDKKKTTFQNKHFNAWRLNICQDFDKFLDVIGIKSKDKGLRKNKLYSTQDRIPNIFITNLYCSLKNKKRYSLRDLKYTNPSRLKCSQFVGLLENSEYDKIVGSDIYWDIVKKVDYVGKSSTVAVSVPKNNNYISNDIISHNTLVTEKLDIPLSMMHDDGFQCGFSSIDAIHIRGVLDTVKRTVENHPILKIWGCKVRTAPNYLFEAKNGWVLEGINMNRNAKNPGEQWFSKHLKKVWIEEASLETIAIYNIRKEALSETGAILRISGMTNFTRYMPAGLQFYAPENQSKVVNLPQFVNPFWDEAEKQDRIKEYGGESDINYRVFVKGEVVEDGVSEIDMERVKQNCYLKRKKIKRFEITKDSYKNFRNLIVVERPKSAERIFINADIGESAGTDVIILSEIENKYNYIYNIVLYNLTSDEQTEFFKWLIEKLNANIIGIDCGDGTGRAVYRGLEKVYPKANLVWYDGSMKVDVDFEKDEKGEIVFRKGIPICKQEFMSEWSVRRLKVLLYEGRIKIPQDFKLEVQLTSVISMQSGTRTIYACPSTSGDHLFDAFRTFSISQWLKKDFNKTPPMGSEWGIGTFAN